jgi:hypothetical protein
MQGQADESVESAGVEEGAAPAPPELSDMRPHTTLASVGLNSQKMVGKAV